MNHTAQKTFPADLATFTGQILNGKLHFLCSVDYCITQSIYQCDVNLQVVNESISPFSKIF